MPSPPTARSLLAHYLAIIYGLAIVYASLQPFATWIAIAPGTPFFLFAPFPPRWTRFDALANYLAYLPFGFFVALTPRGKPALARLGTAISIGVALSFSMETAQMFLPPRDASAIDLIFNVAGAATGGLIGGLLAQSAPAVAAVFALRDRWFLPGKVGDFGIALLAIWLAAQTNPGISLFATTFDPEFLAAIAAAPKTSTDLAGVLVIGATSAFQVLGVGLFLGLLLRHRYYVGGAVLLLIFTAVVVKLIAAALLVKPAFWEHWLSPGVSTGVAIGALLLLIAIFLPRPARVALAAIALLSSVLTPMLTPDVIYAHAPLAMFNWSYGHLLNFNGLTRSALFAWPFAASVLLFALAGLPAWGEPDS
jgi:VanZ family protein